MNITDMTRTRTRRIALSASVLLAGALVVTGCANDDRDDDDTAAGTGTAQSSGAVGGSASGAATSAAASNDALVAAAATARDAVGSGAPTVIGVEQERGGSTWQVLVVTSDGQEHEVHTNAAGSAVEGTPTVDDSDADDVRENERFVAAAELDVADAAGALQDVVAGTVTELGLDDHLGKVVWEGDVRDDSGTKHSIRVDAGSGATVTNTVDTDD